jgi:CTP synthase (UTP-ammonia lyase)
LKIGIVGDFNPAYPSQQATADACMHSIKRLGVQLEHDWIATASISEQLDTIAETYSGFWIAPGLPESADGVLQLIRYAREHNVPLLGTCGGFQNMIVEFAQNKLMMKAAGHEERNPEASELVISKLACSLVGQKGEVFIQSPSLAFDIYQTATAIEQFRCSYGLNPQYAAHIHEAGLKIVGTDAEGKPRMVELPEHKFFIGTLFVPQLSSTPDNPHCLVNSFIEHVTGCYRI